MILYRQYARAERKTLLGLAVALTLLCFFSVWIYVLFGQSGALDQVQRMIADLPGPVQALFSKEFPFTTLEGFQVNLFWRTEFPLIATAFTAIATVAIVSKEADQGTLSFLLSLPVTRTQVLLQRFAALLTGVALLHALVAVMIPVALLSFGFTPNWGGAALLALDAFLMQAAVAAILLALTTLLDDSPIATTASLVLGLGLFILSSILKEEGWQLAVRRLSPFHYYRPAETMAAGALPAGQTAVLIGIFIVATGLALWSFQRKQVSS